MDYKRLTEIAKEVVERNTCLADDDSLQYGSGIIDGLIYANVFTSDISRDIIETFVEGAINKAREHMG